MSSKLCNSNGIVTVESLGNDTIIKEKKLRRNLEETKFELADI